MREPDGAGGVMYLPLRKAALVPLAVATLIVSIPAVLEVLETSKGFQIIFSAFFALFIAAFAAIYIGILLLPANFLAALIANTYGSASPMHFFGLLAGTCIIVQVLMLFALQDFNKTMAIRAPLQEWATYLVPVANAAVLCLTALFYGKEDD